ncbi:MAG: acylphosphatase [Lachnospiraceae bacterium]|jgi:acylphosphatase|nr:acylphosphatase [Lachnospiraceae bacterium]MEE3461825.1 acylphosphatase [Lachnospiraceae bacterium]
MIRKHLIFHGIVQGVGFRYSATYIASDLGLTGWVRNLDDGTVEMEVQGRPGVIDRLIDDLNNTRFIMISHIDEKEIPVVDDERRFRTMS